MNNHHKVLLNEDMKIETANKRLKTVMASINRADERIFQIHRRTAGDPTSEKVRGDLDKAKKTRESAENAYTKALDTSLSTIGTGSGHVMVLLPPRVVQQRSAQK